MGSQYIETDVRSYYVYLISHHRMLLNSGLKLGTRTMNNIEEPFPSSRIDFISIRT